MKIETRPYIYYWADADELFTSEVAPPKNKKNKKLSVAWTFPGGKKPLISLSNVYFIGVL